MTVAITATLTILYYGKPYYQRHSNRVIHTPTYHQLILPSNTHSYHPGNLVFSFRKALQGQRITYSSQRQLWSLILLSRWINRVSMVGMEHWTTGMDYWNGTVDYWDGL